MRKTFGDPIAEDLRYVVKSVVGEENFIDMVPNRSNNYCCGGGGGFLQSGMKEQRLEYGRLKDEQIKRPARIIVLPAAITAMPRFMSSVSITAAIIPSCICGRSSAFRLGYWARTKGSIWEKTSRMFWSSIPNVGHVI